jgi:UDP:flavonoid glycosyltransferase YjiC (YdhE family)
LEKKILFVSWTLGLGHVTRDLAIVQELRRLIPEIEVYWLSCPPASDVLEEAGELVLDDGKKLENDTSLIEQFAEGAHQLNLLRYCVRWAGTWGPNLSVFRQVTERDRYDLVIGDEAYEVVAALLQHKLSLPRPFLTIHDFFGVDPIGNTLLERWAGYLIARTFHRPDPEGIVQFLFAGELEDIVDGRFGWLLPNRKKWAARYCRFLGYILPFSPSDYDDRVAVRTRLGYGTEPLIICSIGGTSIGRHLLELCARTYPLLKQKLPNIRMVLVCGPRLDPQSLDVPEGVELRGYLPALYQHFAASDLAVVQGGGSSTIELTALCRPFVYFPLEEHFEQEIHVAARQRRLGAGIRMRFSATTPQSLAQGILSNIGREPPHPPIKTDGSSVAADIIREALSS